MNFLMLCAPFTSLLSPIAAASLLPAATSGDPSSRELLLPCQTPKDCALNGLCVGGKCHCDAPWRNFNATSGPCTMLGMLPVPTTACGPGCAYHGNTSVLGRQAENSSSWGARVLPSPAGTGYIMVVAEGAYGCDFLSTWRSNSQTAFAVSDTAMGPFRKLGLAVPSWSTCPTLFLPPSGELVITGMGAGYPCAPGALSPALANGTCTNQERCPGCIAIGRKHCHYPQNSTNATAHFHVASSLAVGSATFPWSIVVRASLVNFTLGSWIPDLVTPSPWVMENGTTLIMVHSAGTGSGGPVILRSVSGGAEGWRGPYEVMVTAIDPRWKGATHNCEDQFLWQDSRGNFHVIWHHYGGRDNTWLGRHAWSSDGYEWSDATPAYNNSFVLEKGGGPGDVLVPNANGGAQRPSLLLDPTTRRPTHLYVAASCGGGRNVWSTQGYKNCRPGQYTMAVPLGLGATDDDGHKTTALMAAGGRHPIKHDDDDQYFGAASAAGGSARLSPGDALQLQTSPHAPPPPPPSTSVPVQCSSCAECNGAAAVAIPANATSIDDTAFVGCVGLTSVVIPASVSSIGSGAFQYCESLATVVFEHGSRLARRRPFRHILQAFPAISW